MGRRKISDVAVRLRAKPLGVKLYHMGRLGRIVCHRGMVWRDQIVNGTLGLLIAVSFPGPVVGGVGGDSTASEAKKKRRPRLEQVDEHRYRLGEVELNRREKTLRFPATVHLREELIEYALVHQTGKTHESLLITEVAPYTIHLAGLLLGAEKAEVVKPEADNGGGEDKRTVPSGGGQIRDPEEMTFSGSSVTICVEWAVSADASNERAKAGPGNGTGDEGKGSEVREPEAGKKVKRARLEDWIRNEAADEVMEAEGWIYNSSRFLYGRFMAQREGSIIAIISDPNALINSSHPERTNDEIWRPNEKAVPSSKTAVSVIIKMADSEDDE